ALDLWMLRFKLYSVESDEVTNIIALARMQPAALKLDPGFYEYGGAYLYPLGAWYFALNKIGALQLGSLDTLLADPQRMDGIWIAGRLFVLLAVSLSGWVLFRALCEAGAPAPAWLLALYLFCPATIAYSEAMKPHWYALLWVNAALLVLMRADRRERLG